MAQLAQRGTGRGDVIGRYEEFVNLYERNTDEHRKLVGECIR